VVQTVQPTGGDRLTYERHGEGVPVVFLHGLTFDRTTWRPIVDRLGGRVCSIALDLPGHGDSGGAACTPAEAVARVSATLEALGIGAPVIVGHAISAGIASIYAATRPVRGVVNVDGGVDVRPVAALIQRLEPVLRSEGFDAAFETFQQSMGFDRVSEPLRTLALAGQRIRQEVVLGYWDDLFRADASEMQAGIETALATIDAPYLIVLGHAASPDERSYLVEHVAGIQIEEWPDCGHLVHLAEPDRFAARLRSFIDDCALEGR
jgi:pimeloyl-ACP methyl ester carboxylesterase